jgi:hypothetical protein
MSTYRLVDDGYPTFKKIVRGRNCIGHVRKVESGFLGMIGDTTFKATTEAEAYREVVARYCGHANYSAMKDRNQIIISARTKARAEARYVSEEMIRGNFKPLDQMIGRALKKEEGDV